MVQPYYAFKRMKYEGSPCGYRAKSPYYGKDEQIERRENRPATAYRTAAY